MEVMHLAQYLANNYLYFYLLAFIHLRLNDKMAWNKENHSRSITQKWSFCFRIFYYSFPPYLRDFIYAKFKQLI